MKFFFCLFIALLTISCFKTVYVLEQAHGQFALRAKRESIKELLRDPKATKDLKSKLRLIEEVKNFITNTLGLELEGNYSTYIEVPGESIAKLLVASEKCKIEPYYWSFPIVGKFPYLGFFKDESLRLEAQKMLDKGYDIHIRDVLAYSTLGWFSDPVYSTFFKFDEAYLVSTLVHESVHVNIFKKDDMEFNENIAVFIEEKATEMFLEKKYGKKSQEILSYKNKLLLNQEHLKFLKKTINELQTFYESGKTCEELQRLREKRFEEISNQYKKKFNNDIYINNAYLAEIKLYNVNYESLESEFEKKFKGDLLAFISHYQKQFKN